MHYGLFSASATACSQVAHSCHGLPPGTSCSRSWRQQDIGSRCKADGDCRLQVNVYALYSSGSLYSAVQYYQQQMLSVADSKLTLVAVALCVLLSLALWLTLRKKPVYLMDFYTFLPPGLSPPLSLTMQALSRYVCLLGRRRWLLICCCAAAGSCGLTLCLNKPPKQAC